MGEGIFELEVREKRNQAFLNKSKTGSKGGSSSRKGMRTPFDSMTAKEKRKLNGEVQVTMYETILNHEEFALKDESLQKLMLTRWRELYDNIKIMKDMGLTNANYYKIVGALGLTQKRGGYVKRKTVLKGKDTEEKTKAPEPILEPQTKAVEIQEPQPILLTRGLHLEYNGEYTAEQLQKIFTKLQLITEGEENKFTLAISLTERT